MMQSPDLEFISPTIALWHGYDRAVKADLFSTALVTSAGIYLVDPIQLDPANLEQLNTVALIQGILVTNQNHWRSSAELSKQLSVPVFAHPGAEIAEASTQFTPITSGDLLAPGLAVITIDGAAPGEIALLFNTDGPTLIVGDALINFDPYGFTFLPAKYCANEKLMRKSLRQFLEFDVHRILFAHGYPIVSGGGSRLRQLLEQE